MTNVDLCLKGEAIWGDDFGPDQILDWYEDEEEGYSALGASDRSTYRYVYHALNTWHVYRHLPDSRFPSVLGFGSAYGHELLPILDKIGSITIVDPSEAFQSASLGGVPVTYIKADPSGRLRIPNGTFSLITCFGVLHHIPNVTSVIGELARVLAPGGFLALREPVVSMGDWRYPRPGLTKRERGIPLPLFREALLATGLSLHRFAYCDFPATRRLFRTFRRNVFNSMMATAIDVFLARAFSWNLRYHATTNLQKLRPASAAFVLTKKQDPRGS